MPPDEMQKTLFFFAINDLKKIISCQRKVKINQNVTEHNRKCLIFNKCE